MQEIFTDIVRQTLKLVNICNTIIFKVPNQCFYHEFHKDYRNLLVLNNKIKLISVFKF